MRFLLSCLIFTSIVHLPVWAQNNKISYPKLPQVNQVDDYHGQQVKDPYRYLENSEDPNTQAFIQAENKLTQSYFETIKNKEKITQRLTQLWDFEQFYVPVVRAGKYFFKQLKPGKNQPLLLMSNGTEENPEILLDPNLLSQDATVALAQFEISNDGRYLVYSLARSGSDWDEWHVKDILTKKDLEDTILWSKFSGIAIGPNNDGFYYGRFKEPEKNQTLTSSNHYQSLYFHKIGTKQTQDTCIYGACLWQNNTSLYEANKQWEMRPTVTDDGRYLLITIAQGTSHYVKLVLSDLKAKKKSMFSELTPGFDAEYTLVGNQGSTFYFKTADQKTPKGQLIAWDIKKPISTVQVLIPQSEDLLEQVSWLNHQFIALYLRDAKHEVRFFKQTGTPLTHSYSFPSMGTISGFEGKPNTQETFFSFSNFFTPQTIYKLDFKTQKLSIYKQSQLNYNPHDFVTSQIFYTSKDGTRVPMFISHKKDFVKTGKAPTLLYGYGGFSIALTPEFRSKYVQALALMEQGGVFAVANLRGGSEYGETWHQAGTKLNKQHVFDDFIAAAEWLAQNNYTDNRHLGIMGGSNGGLLVGATLLQRPDLFAAAMPDVGVMDMLRFHKFTIGWAWADDYGCSDNQDEFKALFAYSPVHRAQIPKAYPATLITTADHDDRVVPSHSFKFAATLQASQQGDQPILIRIESKAGHGAGKPKHKQIEEQADRLAFMLDIISKLEKSSKTKQ